MPTREEFLGEHLRGIARVRVRFSGLRAEPADRQDHALESRRPDGVARGLPCDAAVPADTSPQPRKVFARGRILSERCCKRRQCLGGEHVPVACRTKNRGKPADFLYERRDALRTCNGFEQPETRAQPARADTHLMHPFRIGGGCESGGVTGDVAEAALRDGTNAWSAGSTAANSTASARTGAFPPSGSPRTSAYPRAALVAVAIESGQSSSRASANAYAGNGVPLPISISISAIGARCPAARSRFDRADIDRQRCRGSFGKRERERTANDVGCKDRCELPVLLRLGKELAPRRLHEERFIDARPREAPFMFVMRVQRGAVASERRTLHRLQPACAIAPKPQRYSGMLEVEVRRVVVRADHPRRAQSATPRRHHRRVARKISGTGSRCPIQREFELDFGRHDRQPC